MRAEYRPLAVLAVTLVASCGGTGGQPMDQSPPADGEGGPSVAYAQPLVFTLGVPQTMGVDAVTASTTLTVSPALPAGLTLDPRIGTVSGTPTALSPGQPYTVSAVNARGTFAATMYLEVDDGPLFYPSPAILSVGTAMAPLTPSGTRYLSEYSVYPALPSGLSLDTTTGVISGTPTEASPPAYYRISGADVGFNREYGLTLGVVDPSLPTAQASSAPYDCVYSGGFVGTFTADSTDRSYGLIAIAFTPDGRALARVADLTTKLTYDSDGSEGLSAAMDGSFAIKFPVPSNQSLSGRFTRSDLISGTYQNGSVSKSFTASRLGGSPSATYRYTGGFGYDGNLLVDFGTIDVTGSALTGAVYQMTDAGQDYVLINRQLTFGGTISDGKFTVTVDASTTAGNYVAGQSQLAIGDTGGETDEFSLFFLLTSGCQLNM